MSLHVAPELHNYINGAFVPPQSGAFLDDHAPATGRLLTRVPRSGPADVHAAVRAARDAFDSNWRWSAPLDRAALLDRAISAFLPARSGMIARTATRWRARSTTRSAGRWAWSR